MDSLLFLNKKHNNKTVGYNDKLAYITLTKTNKMRHGIHHMHYYIQTYKLQNV